jgi:hypothetical protein
MKKRHLSARSTATAKLVHDITPTREELDPLDPLQNGSLNLSPERITAGASTTTEILNAILQRDEGTGQLRHWGINE